MLFFPQKWEEWPPSGGKRDFNHVISEYPGQESSLIDQFDIE